MAQRNTEIIKINGTDLISESIEKINTNFESLAEVTSIDKQKWQTLMDETKREIDRLKESNDKKEIVISGLIRDLNDKVDNVPTIDNIQLQVNNAIKNADRELSAVISTLAGQYVNNTLGDYAKDADLEKIQTSFESFSADAKNNIATASITAANSKFYTRYKTNDTNKEQQYLVYIDDNKNEAGTSEYKDINDYYEKNKATIDPHNEGCGNSVIAKKLLSECEKKFKTTSTEMATINETVADGFSSVSIIAKVKDAMGAKNTGNNAKDITAAIFATASEAGSGITLNADNILINSGRTLNVQSGGNINIEGDGNFIINSGGKFQIESGNFNIAEDGTVTVKGAIEATSLTIQNGSDAETTLSKFVKDHQDTVSGDVKWLKDALNGGTTIDGGLVLSNAILTKDSADNITAGMIGVNKSGNDIRFFAGPQDILSPITKQKLICVKDTKSEDSPSQIFVRHPSSDKISTSKKVYDMWNKDTYVYEDDINKFQYVSTFTYNESTYYMWKCIGYDRMVILTEERDYTTNNLQYHNNDFSLTPKIVAFLRDDQEYRVDDTNFTYIVAASDDLIYIYVDQFYISYAWELDSKSENVSLDDYHNRLEEHLDRDLTIYTESENVNIDDILEYQKPSSEYVTCKVIDTSDDSIKHSLFRVYEDGTVYMSKGIINEEVSIVSSLIRDEFNGNVTMDGGSLVYNVSGNGYGGTAVIGYRTTNDKALISLYPKGEDPGLYISTGGDLSASAVKIESGTVTINDNSCIDLENGSYIKSLGNAVYKGFKTPIQRIESSGDHYIRNGDDHTIVTAAKGITLKMYESFPVIGTEYDIYVWKFDAKLNLNGQHAVKLVNGTPTEYGSKDIIILSNNTYYHIVYDGICWFIHQ